MSRRHASIWIAIILLLALGSPPALASSHSEAPGTSKDRLADDTDLYAWIASDAPDAEPATWTLPMQVALNVPAPDVPLNSVTFHWKLMHESWIEPETPGSD